MAHAAVCSILLMVGHGCNCGPPSATKCTPGSTGARRAWGMEGVGGLAVPGAASGRGVFCWSLGLRNPQWGLACWR